MTIPKTWVLLSYDNDIYLTHTEQPYHKTFFNLKMYVLCDGCLYFDPIHRVNLLKHDCINRFKTPQYEEYTFTHTELRIWKLKVYFF